MTAKLAGAILALSCSAALCAEPAALPASTTAPATAARDLCRGVVDPYVATVERGRFFAAAGKDSELTETEFAADRKRPIPFARVFDRWDVLISFDKSANKSVDWFEADAYRRDLRKRVMSAFDAD